MQYKHQKQSDTVSLIAGVGEEGGSIVAGGSGLGRGAKRATVGREGGE